MVAVIAGQPAKLLVDMKPEARQFIKLLKFDPNQASSKAALENLLSRDGARKQLSKSAGGRRSWIGREGIPGDPMTTT